MVFLNQIDVALFEILSGNHQMGMVLVWIGIICAKFLIYVIPVHLCVLWFFSGYMERRVALSICVSICAALFLVILFLLFIFVHVRLFQV